MVTKNEQNKNKNGPTANISQWRKMPSIPDIPHILKDRERETAKQRERGGGGV